MRSPLLVHVSATESRKGQADRRYGLTAMNVDEPDDLDDLDDDADDDFLDDEEDDDKDDEDEDDEEDEDEDEPETWQVGFLVETTLPR
jgi:hypothetical protein